ncbi:MAG: MMPL family transporter, partial [Lachnospiraceae bacterium]|nr:MMPL family transporter [Lachnospiraceae bacterium]
MSSDETMDAIEEIRRIAGKQCFLSGMSAVVLDTKNLSNRETPIYVVIAVILSTIVLSLTMDSAIIPLFFLLSIGMAIVYNLGSNIFLGEISYITQALTAVLQLGVTMDYSIFLWHSYQEQKSLLPPGEAGTKEGNQRAMADAIAATITSVVGSSVTTVAGFIALCFMSFTLGMDLGIVMAKGVVIGVICCVTVLPAMILLFDRIVEKTRHKAIIPEFRISKFVVKRYIVIAVLFVLIWIPALYGYFRTDVYYNLDETLPRDLDSIVANTKLSETFDMNTTHMLLVDSALSPKEVSEMAEEMKQVDGVKNVIGMDALLGPSVPRDIIPSDVKEMLQNDNYQLMLISSEYKVASDEVNAQCDKLNAILKRYDESGMLIGEAPCTKDLITITDKDFKVVSAVSIGVIFVIIALVFRSISLPVILVSVIEFAIFINMSIPFYTKTEIPFIASIVIGTIQLGATVDYAILMTNRYKTERLAGADKKEAVFTAHQTSIQSIFVSALSFFAATIGVGVYSNIDMISSLCTLMSRGAIISMIVVLTVLPAMLMLFDKLICVTTWGMREKKTGSMQLRSKEVHA